MPDAVTSSRMHMNSCCTSGSSPFVGSSRISSSGRDISAPTSATLRRFPVERPRTCRSTCTPSRSMRRSRNASSTPPRSRAQLLSVAATVSRSSKRSSPGEYPTRARTARPRNGSSPKRRTVPDVGFESPSIIRIVVLLPAPFGPRKPSTVPGKRSSSRSCTAVKLPNLLVSLSQWMIGGVVMAAPRSPSRSSPRSRSNRLRRSRV